MTTLKVPLTLRGSCLHTGYFGYRTCCFLWRRLLLMKPFLHDHLTHLFIFVSCMQIGFHTALRLYVQLLPQCFVAVRANTHVTYILDRENFPNMTQLMRLTNGDPTVISSQDTFVYMGILCFSLRRMLSWIGKVERSYCMYLLAC
jgi:hypothetical protein